MRLLFFFIDGVGLGSTEPGNPFVSTATPGLSGLLEGGKLTAGYASFEGSRATLVGLDASLGVPGLPQSATGQASIFTGTNAPAYIKSHLNGFPDDRLRKLLSEKGIFRQLKKQGFRVAFANAYRPAFFEMLRRGLPGNLYSCSTLITYYGGLPFLSLKDLEKGRALYMDITNELLAKTGFAITTILPELGAERLAKISNNFDFTLFEYFLSDLAGHMADRSESGLVIATLDRFIGKLADSINLKETLIIITSDHGNLEDLTGRDHTLNKVPALLIGDKQLRRNLQEGLHNLTDLLPAVQKTLIWPEIN